MTLKQLQDALKKAESEAYQSQPRQMDSIHSLLRVLLQHEIDKLQREIDRLRAAEQYERAKSAYM